jgi:hypothetical protein
MTDFEGKELRRVQANCSLDTLRLAGVLLTLCKVWKCLGLPAG